MCLVSTNTAISFFVHVVGVRYVLATPALEVVGYTEMGVTFALYIVCAVANKSTKKDMELLFVGYSDFIFIERYA